MLVRQGRTESDLDAGAARLFAAVTLDDRGRAVRFRAQLDPLVAGDDDERARRGQHRARDDAQPVAERAALRQPQQLAG